MSKVIFETYSNDKNDARSDYRDTIIWLLNRMNTELMVLSKQEALFTDAQYRVATALLLSTCTTGANISQLVEKLSVCSKDALPLARSFYESCLQACLVLSDSGEFAERAELYSIYKTFSNQTQHYKLGDKKGTIALGIRLDRKQEIVAKAVELFSPTRGKKAKSCFNLSRREMIDTIKSRSPYSAICFQGVEGMNFDLASEISHGSYYAFQVAAGHFPSSVENHEIVQDDFAFRATSTVALCSDAVARLILSIKDDLEEAKVLSQACNVYFQEEIPEMSEGLSKLEVR
ncbi:hypothetical protein [Sulfitobacter pontiacus]|uniref:hypothetical protein n=1 Tax=Sulfitobacter pontiacus TaxID=60137 RepID=UPI0010467F46|nr:hypothetical protein [Sulfitobacter pontiacus]